MSANKHNEPYKQLPLPPQPQSKQPLKKTVSAPQGALSRLLGHQRQAQGDDEETRISGGGGGGEGRKGGGKVAKRRMKNKRSAETGEGELTTELLSAGTTVLEGNLIEFDEEANSSSSIAASPSSSLPSRSASVSGRPSLRRPPPPPPARDRLATVPGGPVKSPKIPPTPPPKPAYLSEQAESSSVGLAPATGEGKGSKKKENGEKPEPKPRLKLPSPYLTFMPTKDRLEVATAAAASIRETSNGSSTSSPSSTPPTTKKKLATSRSHPITFANPPPREMEYAEREHPRRVFDYLNKMRHKGDLCDVTLIASSREIHVHRVILAACSPYFESMFIGEFSEPDGEPIVIEEVEDDALEALVNFAYTSRIRITDRNIYLIFAAADLLQFSGVRSACFKFFKQQMNKSNCIRTWLFGEGHNCTELLDAALKYIECNFLDVVRGREFLDLDRADVVAKLLELEDIAVTGEEQVYEAALNWVRHDLEARAGDAGKVLKSIRFPNMSRDFLLHIVETEEIVKGNSDCLQMLIDALESLVSGNRTRLRKKLPKKDSGTYMNVKPRPASMAVETVEICRNNESLGLRIMGGSERPHHVFRQGDKPGIFILMVTANGAAAKSGRLRTGDRILKVNGNDMSSATHDQAIRLLKTSPDPLSLLVRHEPSPPGLQELTLVTKPGEGFGISLSGGVNGYHGNPLDETDEGIFISQIIPGGAAERDGRLKQGNRILQVNSISMLGKTHSEALQVLQGVLDRINLLVCFGYDPATLAAQYSDDCEGQTEDSVDDYVGDDNRYTGGGGLLV